MEHYRVNVYNYYGYYTKKKTIILFFNNLYNFSDKHNKVFFLYSFRVVQFARISNFLKILNLKTFVLLKILKNFYDYLWVLFLKEPTIQNYRAIIIKILEFYQALLKKQPTLNVKNTRVYPTNFLLSFLKKYTSRTGFRESEINSLLKFVYKIKGEKFNFAKDYEFVNLQIPKNIYKVLYTGETVDHATKFSIHFLRVQRRYNKRRYSRVRAFSRPPFFAGITLSTAFLACFWGGTMKGVDWRTPWIINIDINIWLLIFFGYFVFRYARLFSFNTFYRSKDKIKIISIIYGLFETKLLKYYLNRQNVS